MKPSKTIAAALIAAVLLSDSTSYAEEEATAVAEKPVQAEKEKAKALQQTELVKGKLTLPVPGEWASVKPRNRLIKHEFSIPAAKGDKEKGRMTIMAAGGGVEANIARWVGQFQTAAGKPLSEDDKKVEKKEIGDLEIHIVDLRGTFLDKPRGPFGPSVARPDYRMLAAIVPVEKSGTWFIKLYGPKATIAAAEKSFRGMIAGVNK